jgi:hypothetical protein
VPKEEAAAAAGGRSASRQNIRITMPTETPPCGTPDFNAKKCRAVNVSAQLKV